MENEIFREKKFTEMNIKLEQQKIEMFWLIWKGAFVNLLLLIFVFFSNDG